MEKTRLSFDEVLEVFKKKFKNSKAIACNSIINIKEENKDIYCLFSLHKEYLIIESFIKKEEKSKRRKRDIVENNIIELKHYLNLKIKKKDIVNYCYKIGFIKEDNDNDFIRYTYQAYYSKTTLLLDTYTLQLFVNNKVFINGNENRYELYTVLKILYNINNK